MSSPDAFELLGPTDNPVSKGLVHALEQGCHQRHIDQLTIGVVWEKQLELNAAQQVLDQLHQTHQPNRTVVILSSGAIYGEGRYFCGDCGLIDQPITRSEDQLKRYRWDPPCPHCCDLLMPVLIDETAETEPSAWAAFEAAVHQLDWKAPVFLLRLSEPYWSDKNLLAYPTDKLPTVMAMAQTLLATKALNLPEGGNGLLDAIPLDHVLDLLELIAQHEAKPGVMTLNAGSGTCASYFELGCQLWSGLVQDPSIPPALEVTADYGLDTPRHQLLSVAATRDLLNYEPAMGWQNRINLFCQQLVSYNLHLSK